MKPFSEDLLCVVGPYSMGGEVENEMKLGDDIPAGQLLTSTL